MVEAGTAAGVRLLISKVVQSSGGVGFMLVGLAGSRALARSAHQPRACMLAHQPPLPAVALRALQGWGGLGEGLEAAPEGVLLLDKPCPHDWLFQRCAGVVHHGGAGTTAAGIKAGERRTRMRQPGLSLCRRVWCRRLASGRLPTRRPASSDQLMAPALLPQPLPTST